MRRWNRRTFVALSGAAVLGHAGSRAWGTGTGRRDDDGPLELGPVIDAIVSASRDDAIPAVRPWLDRGLGWDDLLAATFLAGIHHVRPRPVGFKLHCVMVVESMFQLAELASADERLLAALWNVDDFKQSQARDESEGDWELPPPAAMDKGVSKESAARELVASLEARDDERADRAAHAAASMLTRDELFERLWPFAMRDFQNLGHKPIYAAHIDAVMGRVALPASPAIRTLVHGILDGDGTAVEEYDASRAIAARFPDDWADGERRPTRSLEIARGIRAASPDDARQIILEGVEQGLHPDTLWDGIRLAAADLFARGPSLLPVHTVTVSNALRCIHRSSRVEETRRVALLQAASWLPLFRDWLSDRSRISMRRPGIDELLEVADGPAPSIEETFDDGSRSAVRSLLDDPNTRTGFETTLRGHLLRGATEHHMPKYAAAAMAEARLADATWRPALLASALEYLPTSRTRTTQVHARSLDLIASLRSR